MTPQERKQWRRITTGLYDDRQGGLHIDLRRFLRAYGCDGTKDDGNFLIANLRDLAAYMGGRKRKDPAHEHDGGRTLRRPTQSRGR